MIIDWSAVLIAIIGLVGSSGVASVVTALLNRQWKKQDKSDAIAEALKVLMAHEIRCIGSSYIYAGEISLDDKETLDRMYDAYMALPGADGLCGTVKSLVDKLPVTSEKEEDHDDL